MLATTKVTPLRSMVEKRKFGMCRFGALLVLGVLLSTLITLFTTKPANYILASFESSRRTTAHTTGLSRPAVNKTTMLRGETRAPPTNQTLLSADSPKVEESPKLHPVYADAIKMATENTTNACFPWKLNVDAWWQDNPEWEISRMTEKTTCFSKKDTPKTRFFRKLYDLQNGDCSQLITRKIVSASWGTYFTRMAYLLQFGLDSGVPVQISNNTRGWRYARAAKEGSEPVCPTEDMFCYFLPISHCQPGELDVAKPKSQSLPHEQRRWLVEYVTRPQHWLRKRVHEFILDNGPSQMNEPCAVMYIESPKPGKQTTETFGLEDYVSTLRRTDTDAGPRNNILLFSEEPDVYSEASEKFPEYNWMYLKGEESEDWDPVAEIVSGLASYHLAKQCDVIVQSRSTAANLIYDRMATTAKSITQVYVSKALALPSSPMDSVSKTDRMCVPWGANMDSWWTHNPEYILDTETENQTCFIREDSPRTRFFRQIYENQYLSGDCSAVYTKHMWSSGFNADMHNVMDGLVYGLEQKRPFQIAFDPNHSTSWHYAALKDGSKPVCPSADMFCFFLQLSPCKPGKIDPEAFRSKILAKNGPERPWLNDYVARPQQWLRRRVYEYIRDKAPKIEQPCTVMHVRRTDVVLHAEWSRKYFAISDYLERLRKEGVDGKNILLLTDDQNAIDEAVEFHPDYNWMYLNRTRHRGTEGGWENQVPSKDPIEEMVALLATFKLVKQCDTIVHGESGFSDTLKFHMQTTGKQIRVLHVEDSLDWKDMFNRNNTKSAEELQKKLEERRKEKSQPQPKLDGKAVTTTDSRPNTSTESSSNNELICVPWEVNLDDWWKQNPDWDVVSESKDKLCFAKQNSTKAGFFRKLYDLQFVTGDCSQTETRHMWSSGFGADLGNVVDGLMYALETKKPFQIELLPKDRKTGWHYAALKGDGSNAVCERKDMFCYFLPISGCEPTEIKQVGGLAATMTHQTQRWLFEYATRPQQWLRKRVFDYLETKAPVPDKPCAVMHVRRADVVLHGGWSRKYFAIEDYLRSLRQANVDYKNILLLTDDANALDEALEFHPDYSWTFLNRTRHKGAEGGWENQIPSKDPAEEVITIMATFKLVQQCNAIVHGESNFSDLLYDSMVRSGQSVKRVRVDQGHKKYSLNNKASPQQLQQRLEEKRKQRRSAEKEQS